MDEGMSITRFDKCNVYVIICMKKKKTHYDKGVMGLRWDALFSILDKLNNTH